MTALQDHQNEIRPANHDFTRELACQNDPSPSLEAMYRASMTVLEAVTPSQQVEAFRIRYQVYCLDNAFEKAEESSDGLESDDFDDRSVQVLLRHDPTGTFIGTSRLILPAAPDFAPSLPMLRVSGLDGAGSPHPFPLARTAEVSRFSITRGGRRLVGEAASGEHDRRLLVLHLPLGLIGGLIAAAEGHGMTHFCAVMEPCLIRLLGRFGIHFTAHGNLVEHHGLRQPCWIEIAALLEQVGSERPDILPLLIRHSAAARVFPFDA